MSRRRRSALGLLLALVVSGALVACGGSDGIDGVATAGGGGSTSSPSSSAGTDNLSDEERRVKFAQCMRDQGIEVEVEEVGEGGFGLKMGKGADQKKVEAAMQKCREYLPNGGEPPEADPQQQEQARKMAQCMRDHGITNFPDPDENGGIRMGPDSGIDPDDPKFKAAQQACAQYQPKAPQTQGTKS